VSQSAGLVIDSPGNVTSGQIQTDHDVAVRRPHQARREVVGEGGKLNIERGSSQAGGYVTPTAISTKICRSATSRSLGSFPLGQENYTVEAAFLGRTTDYGQSSHRVWTKTAPSPAGRRAGQGRHIAQGPHAHLINFEESRRWWKAPNAPQQDETEVLNPPVEGSASVRSYTLPQERQTSNHRRPRPKTKREMLRTKNFGRNRSDINDFSAGLGLSFGMKFDPPGALRPSEGISFYRYGYD